MSAGARNLIARLEEIEAQMYKVSRLIEGAALTDHELGAGLATTEPLAMVDRKLTKAAASVEGFTRVARRMEITA